MRSSPLAVAVLLILALASGCQRKPQVPVNSRYEMVPPIARTVEIKQLRGGANGKILVVADFGRGVIPSRFHAVYLGEETVVLEDDGRGGDEAADDGRFSVEIKENVDSLAAEITTSERRMGVAGARPAVFRGRERVPPESIPVPRFDFQQFQNKLVPIDLNWLCPFLHDTSIPHSLMVTDLGVVEDFTRASQPCTNPSATRAWSFGKLMTDMANPSATTVSGEDFVKNWLDTWLHDQTVNGDPIQARQRLFNLVIQPWVIASGSPAGSFTIDDWKTKPLDLAKAPFKLTAIVNRLDLRGNAGYGFANPGEGRFVFEVLNPNTCSPLSPAFTVILEYGIPIHSCVRLKDFAQQWYDLKNETVGSATYNAKLGAITDQFAKANAAPSKPNGSAINQIRTNEIVLSFGDPSISHSVWELREFNVDPSSHQLVEVTVKQEPAKKFNAKAVPPGTAADVLEMTTWVNANTPDIVNGTYEVPVTLNGHPFLGGKSHTEPGGFWDGTNPGDITDDAARFQFSFHTCSGCHGGETQTGFLHVGGAPFGSVAPLSGFLTGINVNDRANRPPPPFQHHFADLEQRQQSLNRLLCTRCRSRLFELVDVLTFKPLNMTH